MSESISDFMVHVGGGLSAEDHRHLEECVHDDPCVISAGFSHHASHLMTVVYDCECTHARDILDHVRDTGRHATML
jgi:hypothetical protein